MHVFASDMMAGGTMMNKDRIIRYALWISVAFNLFGALLFAFPASPLGQFAGLPVPVPTLYSMMLALFVVLFAGMYFWLALQPKINRPMVAFSAIGKASSFVLMVILCLLGDIPGRSVLFASGDLIFACIFAWWLLKT
jgi:hypothetical protein